MSHGIVDHNEENGKSMALRLLIHYSGDIHQPLHAENRFNANYTNGDRGGNDFPIPEIPGTGVNELHAVWDSIIYQ